MKTKSNISIYFVDNNAVELENFRENLSIDYPYELFTFSSPEMFINKLKSDNTKKLVKLVVVDYLIVSRGMNTTTAIELIPKIKDIDPNIEVIIFADSDNIELKATGTKIKPVAFIKKDLQYFIRLEAIINRLISEKEVKNKYKKIKLAAILLASIFFIGSIIFTYIYFFHKELL